MINKDKIYPAAGRRFAPWKNGGGETAEIAVSPLGAGLDDFDWRISTAKVSKSGPFSTFPGVERCLTVIEGGHITLNFAYDTIRDIGPGTKPVYFSGNLDCNCELTGPTLLDLNVMVREPYRCRVSRLNALTEGVTLEPTWRLIFASHPIPALGLEKHDLADITQMPMSQLCSCFGENDDILDHMLLIEIVHRQAGPES